MCIRDSYNIANEARKRGAEVVLISGPVNPIKVNGIKRIEIKDVYKRQH